MRSIKRIGKTAVWALGLAAIVILNARASEDPDEIDNASYAIVKQAMALNGLFSSYAMEGL
ncbi:MAG: hypothetical protein LBJ92_02900 [Holosporales bacterium]|jgi:hypothetical protein|nr:hypothetical protein [Holosporales bacterium]